MENENTPVKCSFCLKLNPTYTCPRCHSTYCSKSCYQSPHHLDCSEQFYKECVEEELKLENASDSSKKQMMEILCRFQSEVGDEQQDDDSDDEDSLSDLYDRLQNIDLNNAEEVWKRLNEQEKLEFQAILNSGDVSQLIPEYEPWWCKRYEKKIEELEDFLNEKNKQHYIKLCPSIMKIVPFETLSKVIPSPQILCNITNVLAAYTYAVRRYVGDHHDFCGEALDTVVSISNNLSVNENFDSKESAVDNVIFHVTNNQQFLCSKEEASLLKEDVDKLLSGPEDSEPAFYALAAISDLHQLCSVTISREKKSMEKDDGEFSKRYPLPTSKTLNKGKLRLIMKKLEFYASWLNDHYK